MHSTILVPADASSIGRSFRAMSSEKGPCLRNFTLDSRVVVGVRVHFLSKHAPVQNSIIHAALYHLFSKPGPRGRLHHLVIVRGVYTSHVPTNTSFKFWPNFEGSGRVFNPREGELCC